MSAGRQRLGRWGERRAARYLRRRGLRILTRNWSCGIGELDLIAMEGPVLVIVEVRTSRAGFAGGPLHTVGPHKQRKLAQLAQLYMRETGLGGSGLRFDVVGVIRQGWWRAQIDWVKAAFEV